jgi:EAL domain-containing protein (putative c-di-GMP-specific phosphodiesterase class I)
MDRADTHRRPAAADARRAELRLAARERRRDAERLTDALDGDQLRLVQLPRLRLSDGTETAIEAALYWSRRALPVAASLAASPRAAVAERIGHWLLDEACTLAATKRHAPISISLPGAMLLGKTLPAILTTALQRARLTPDRLELRLAEAALNDPSTDLLLCLSALCDQGIRLVLEDFGARTGSITLLRRLPLHAVRLDPSLTHDISAGGEDECIVAAITAIAHTCDMRVIACAVDGHARRLGLLRLGVDEGLGQPQAWAELADAA